MPPWITQFLAKTALFFLLRIEIVEERINSKKVSSQRHFSVNKKKVTNMIVGNSIIIFSQTRHSHGCCELFQFRTCADKPFLSSYFDILHNKSIVT